jgi:trigger factor
MQVTETLSDGLKRAFAVVVPAADIESRRTTRLSELAKQVNLPGFRPGKVPMPIVRQRFGGAVAAEVMEQSINEATQALLAERSLRPAVMPKLEMVTLEPASLGPAKDLEFKLELELLPEIPMPDFSTFTLTRHVAKVPAEELDKAVADIAERNRDLVEFSPEELAARGDNLGAAKGDVMTIDYLGKIDGVPFPGGTATDTDVDIGGSGFIPGFVEQMEGMRPGESKTIEVTFPADYQAENLKGKLATFEITAKQHRKAVPAAIDDTLAEKLGFDSLENLRETLEAMRRRRLDALTRMRLKRDLLDELAKHASFEPPEALVNQEFEQIWKNLEAGRTSGTMDEDDKQKSEDQLRADYRAIADRRVRLGLLLGEIGRVNSIVVTPEEVGAAIRAEAARYPGQEAQMIEFYRNYPAATDALRGPIFEDKVVDYVLDSATVTDAEISIEALEADPEETKPADATAQSADTDTAAETTGAALEGSPAESPAAGESGTASP